MPRSSGFTLIELIMVIILLGSLPFRVESVAS